MVNPSAALGLVESRRAIVAWCALHVRTQSICRFDSDLRRCSQDALPLGAGYGHTSDRIGNLSQRAPLAIETEMPAGTAVRGGSERGEKAQPCECPGIQPAPANDPCGIIGPVLDAIEPREADAGSVGVKHYDIAMLVFFLAAVLAPATHKMFMVTEAALANDRSIADLGEDFFFLSQRFVTPATEGDRWLVVSDEV
jgi:hypothetical protein